ncbi:protein kinase domain-containing protein [Kolteria novifilia]|uniref:protein kinase domain-containing protein n=1 Tax=Kolteria novifilia TaxID=2527975 RepID=UPI003AF33DE1
MGRLVERCESCQLRLDDLTQADAEQLIGDLPTQEQDSDPALEQLLSRMREEPPEERSGEESEEDDNRIEFPEPPTSEAPLGRLASYHIHKEIARGGSGVLFRAYDTRLGRTVALKVLKGELAAIETERARFIREARAAAALAHENVVTVHDVGSPPNFPPYLVMEYIDGETLSDRLGREGLIDPTTAAQIVRQAAKGVGAAHRQGIVHRDIKPSNIMLDRMTGQAKITDFGLARALESAAGVTREGVIAGTPAYMSPEQITNPSQVDGRSDVYALGVVLYELLTGEPPFRGVLRMTLLQAIHDDPRPPRRLNDRIPRDIETICLKAMSKEPSRRYVNVGALVDDLGRWLAGEPVLARPIGPVTRFARWCQRNPGVATLSVAVFMLLLTVTGVSVFAAVELAQSNAKTAKALEDSERSLQERNEQYRVVETILQDVIIEISNGLQELPDTHQFKQYMLNESLAGIRLQSGLDDSDRIDMLEAVAQIRIGEIFLSTGRTGDAAERFAQAVRISEELLETELASTPRESTDLDESRSAAKNDTLHVLSVAIGRLGDASAKAGDLQVAGKHYSEALAISRKYAEEFPDEVRAKWDLASACDRFGDIALETGKVDLAAKHFVEALMHQREILRQQEALVRQDDFESPQRNREALQKRRQMQRDVAVCYQKNGRVLLRLGHGGEARESFEQAHKYFVALSNEDPRGLTSARDLAASHVNLAELASLADDIEQTAAHLRTARELLEKLAKRDPKNVDLKHDLALISRELAARELQSRRYEDARTLALDAVRLTEELTRRDQPSIADQRELVLSYRTMAAISERMKEYRGEADQWDDRALQRLSVLLQADQAKKDANWKHWIESQVTKIKSIRNGASPREG